MIPNVSNWEIQQDFDNYICIKSGNYYISAELMEVSELAEKPKTPIDEKIEDLRGTLGLTLSQFAVLVNGSINSIKNVGPENVYGKRIVRLEKVVKYLLCFSSNDQDVLNVLRNGEIPVDNGDEIMPLPLIGYIVEYPEDSFWRANTFVAWENYIKYYNSMKRNDKTTYEHFKKEDRPKPVEMEIPKNTYKKPQIVALSYTELITDSLRFFKWVYIQTKVDGNSLILINKKTKKEYLVDPFKRYG